MDRDLDPVIVTETRQDFRGVRYYRDAEGYYGTFSVDRERGSFNGSGPRLHRAVYAAAHGPIPERMHVHHRDYDRSNNRLSNLKLVTPGQHARMRRRGRHQARREPDKLCTIEGCGRAFYALDWCRAHYDRARRNGGDPQAEIPLRPKCRRVRGRKLTDEQVRWVREADVNSGAAARELGVTPAAVLAIRAGTLYDQV